MASLFLPKPTNRRRAISNGGLGGLIEIAAVEIYGAIAVDYKGTWSKRKKHRPSPLDIRNGVTGMAFTPLEGPVHRDEGCGNPKTSTQNSPTTRGRQPPSSPAELPGSLLQPSQGFPQSNPPATPQRHLTPQRRLTDETTSELSSIPSLSRSSSSDGDRMELLKPFSSPKRTAAKLVKAVESSLSSTSDGGFSLVTKPMSRMSIEELLQHLPGLNLNVVNQVWLPAMQLEYAKVKILLQDAAELKVQTHHQLKNFGEDLIAATHEARKIAGTYEKALQSAESLLERDTKVCSDRLESAESNLEGALANASETRDQIEDKDQMIAGLRQTVEYVVKELGSFIQDMLPHVPQVNMDERFRMVMEIIADHSRNQDSTSDERPLPYLRVNEDVYLGASAKARVADAKVAQYLELAREQNKVLQNQSSELDDHVRRYEILLSTVKERDHEVLLLAEHNSKYQALIDNYEKGMCIPETTRTAHERLVKQNYEMDCKIKSLEIAHARELENRNAEIANFRQKLGSAREEVLARKADVKNVITQTQALLSPAHSPTETCFGGGHTAKERKLMAKEKAKRGYLPGSISMTSLPFFASKMDLAAVLNEDRNSDKELVSAATKPAPRMAPRIEKPEWNGGNQKKRSFPDLNVAGDSLPDCSPKPRRNSLGAMKSDLSPAPCIDSLGVVENFVRSLGLNTAFTEFSTSAADVHKQLPNPPPRFSDDLYQDSQASHYEAVTRPPNPDPIQPDPSSMAIHRRVLSNIPEVASIASSESDKDISSSISMTSSDREAYRKSLDALNLIDFMQEGDLRLPRIRKPEVAPVDYEGLGYGQTEEDGEHEEVVETGVAHTVKVAAVTGLSQGVNEMGKKDGGADDEALAKPVSHIHHSGRKDSSH